MYFVSFSPEINYYSLTKGRIPYLASYSMLQLFRVSAIIYLWIFVSFLPWDLTYVK